MTAVMKRCVWGMVGILVLAACQTGSTRVFNKQGGVVCDLNQAACLRAVYSADSRYWPAPTIDAGVDFQELQPLSPQIPPPEHPEQVALGKALFFEPRLSDDGQVSCASCHLPYQGFAEKNAVSTGVYNRKGRRNAQALLHLGTAQSHFFWDGRAANLEQQALMPLTDPVEMNQDLAKVPSILKQAGYEPRFQAAFGEGINIAAVAKALSEYQRTLRPEPTQFDAFLLGDPQALSDEALQGLHLFRTKARCMNCHTGQMLTDGKLHNLNQTLAGRKWEDFGRYEITYNVDDWGKFKTASLRNLSKTKPWFHHGLFVNLQGVVAMYNIGMREGIHKDAPAESHRPHLDPLIQPLNLSPEERRAVTRFLETL